MSVHARAQFLRACSAEKAPGLLWTGKKIKEEHKHYIENKMTPANLRRWGTYSAALAELAGCDARMVKEVLRGRFGSARGTRGKPKQLGLTVEANRRGSR